MTTDVYSGLDKRRTLLLALLLTFGFAVIVGQLIRYQLLQHSELKQLSDRQVTVEEAVDPGRGYITDSKGNILAMDMSQWAISADTPYIPEASREATARALAPLLDCPSRK